MDSVDLPYLCRTLATLSGVPTRIFKGDTLLFYHSVVFLPKDPMNMFWRQIQKVTDHVGYFITPRFYLYGIINSGDIKIVVGPTAQITANERSLHEMAFQADVPKKETQAFVDGIKNIIPIPLESLLMMLCPINYILNNETLELKDVVIQKEEQEEIKRRVEHRRTKRVYETQRQGFQHNSLLLEESLMDMVRRGDSSALKAWISQAPAIRGGVLASDAVRQLKNIFIVTATLTSRAAIRGGMDVEDALNLSDAYIQKAETLSTQSGITNLQYNMVLEFTERVEKVRHGKTPSKLMIEVANYVQHHISEPISTEELANALFLSRTHLSSKFKKETGMSLTDFILNEKTEEAKRLLRYSDKSLTAIWEYLGFSSHSHFSKVFKKYAGLTPYNYRNKAS